MLRVRRIRCFPQETRKSHNGVQLHFNQRATTFLALSQRSNAAKSSTTCNPVVFLETACYCLPRQSKPEARI